MHPNIKFTVEHADNTFPFLNVELRIVGDTFESWIYRKKTHTGLMLNFSALVPTSWKRGLILCLLNTAKKLCSSPNLFNKEVDKLRCMFSDNGYPVGFFNSVLHKFTAVHENVTTDESDEDTVILKVPYLGEISYEFSKKLKVLIGNKFNVKVRVVFTSFKVGQYFSLKCKTPLILLSDVVYKFSCQRDATVTYIGKTKRHLITRVNEHLTLQDNSQKSEVKSHLLECASCRDGGTGMESFEIVKKCQNSFDVIIHEALSIKRHNPKLNKQLFKSGSFYTCKIY